MAKLEDGNEVSIYVDDYSKWWKVYKTNPFDCKTLEEFENKLMVLRI